MSYGLKIVINGVFDLLHSGHKELIEKALFYSCGGKVLILINSDKYTKELKGEDRPIDSVTKRGSNIQNVIDTWIQKQQYIREAPSNEIVIFNSEKELKDNLNKFQPDILLKRDEYDSLKDITGANKWPVLFLHRPRNKDNTFKLSTSNIIEKWK